MHLDKFSMHLKAKLFLCVWLGAVMLLATSMASAAETYPTFEVYLTTGGEQNRPRPSPQNQFECAEKIYAVVKVTASASQKKSKHLLIVNWLNPGDRLEQKTRYPFHSYGKGTQVWAWLKLSGSTGSSIGQIFDPAYGMDKFIGQWRAEFIIDDKKIATLPFDVLC